YMAHDLLYQNQQYADRYTPADLDAFVTYMESGLKGLTGENEELRSIFLRIYANPVEGVGC
ncbi:MAG: acyltransferase, partial [Bacteroidales bacterium]|nr:acyltransferase [Bacteroidales bacterium]